MEPKLCYVDGHFAYYTTQELSKQWGDDWNDIPYECNAGEPYEPHKNCKEDWKENGEPKWKIEIVAFQSNFDQPCSGFHNSPYSVEDINKGKVPWLKSDTVSIPAGATKEQFIEV